VHLVAQSFGLGDGENAFVDATGGEIRQCIGRQRRRRRCWWHYCPLGLPPLVPEVPSDRVLMPTTIIMGRPWDRRRVIRVETDTAIDGGWD